VALFLFFPKVSSKQDRPRAGSSGYQHVSRKAKRGLDKQSMMEVLHEEHEFSDMFVAYLLTGNIRYERIWSTTFSIPARKDWPEYCYC
jgi:hypothetical protein